MEKRRKAGVLFGPWRSINGWRTRRPDERAGSRNSDEHSTVLSMGNTDFGPRGCRHIFIRPPLQLNLPFPGIPTLGQIARNPELKPAAPRLPISPRQPAAVARCLEAEAIEFWGLDPDRLLQDPDCYDETQAT